jgi:hypothetical protein
MSVMNRMEIDPTLREELLQMVATDQDARQRLDAIHASTAACLSTS